MKKVNVRRSLSFILSLMLVMTCYTGVVPAASDPDIPGNSESIVSNEILNAQNNITSIAVSSLSPDQQKLSGNLLQLLHSDLLPAGRSRNNLLKDMEKMHQLSASSSKKRMSASANGQVYVYIKLAKSYDLENLSPFIGQVVSEDRQNCLLAAWVDIDQLEGLASLNDVISIRSVLPPVAKSGSITSQGDAVHRADLVRALGVDGSGIKIGIISDGANHWTSARQSGDLPEDVSILEDDIPWGGEEGTALMEIVYDLAPGAKLYFHDCGTNILEFNQAIDELVEAGCSIICDDITWTDEPFFEDGVIASHVKELISQNEVIYVSSAGNYGLSHNQGLFTWTYDDGSFWHNFGRGHSKPENLEIQIPAGGIAWIVLEWNEPFGRSKCNYDLYLLDAATGEPLMASAGVQNGSQDPYEFIGVGNDSSETADALIAIKASNPYAVFRPRILETYIYGAYVDNEHITPEDSIFGHPAVPGVIACAAVAAQTPDDIEEFSSRGPVTMLSGTRPKPDLCGADQVDVTGSGGFYTPFYGTSASAPHVAAVAALLWSKYPDLTSREIREKLFDTAVDLGKHGRDNIYGYGRVDALNACAAELKIDSLMSDKDSPQPSGETIRWTCEARGEGELSYSWQVYRGAKRIAKTDFASDNYFDWIPDKKGKYQIKVIVKDASGQTQSLLSKRFTIR